MNSCAVIQALSSHLYSKGQVDLAYFLRVLEFSKWSVKTSFNLKSLAVSAFFFFFTIYFLLKDNCFTEFCCFLSNLNMNHFHFHALEKEMATHSSVLAWRIPGMGEPGGLPSMVSHRVGHDWSDLAAAAGAISSKESACQCRRCKRVRFDPWVVENGNPPCILG